MRERAYPDRGLHGWVVHEIGLRIVSGELGEGNVLPNESDLGTELGVSRSVLREGIKVLAGKGLVEVRPKTGTRVRPRRYWHLLDPDVLGWRFEEVARHEDLWDLMEIREIVEPAAARLAASRRRRPEAAEIEAHYQRMEADAADPEAFIAADLDFHSTIFRASHNDLLEHVNSMIWVALRAGRRAHTRQPDRYIPSLPLHAAVMEAIRGEDPDAAQRAMEILIAGARRDLRHYLRENG